MYDRRIKIFITVIVVVLLACLLRLTDMQLLSDSFLQDEIAKLKRQRGRFRQLKTVRGKILDRNSRILAANELKFWLIVDYKLTSCMDPNVQQGRLLRAAQSKNSADTADRISEVKDELKITQDDLAQVIDKCTGFGLDRKDIENTIKKINRSVWNLRSFLAWRRNNPDPEILNKYPNIMSVPFAEAMADFKKKFSDRDQRLLRIIKVDDIAELNYAKPILELKTEDDIFTAQFEFMNIEGVDISSQPHRTYPYNSVAAQTIGWLGRPQGADKQPFADDRLLRYLDDELCGREDGVESVCETILRGRRGEIFYDIDGNLSSRVETEYGKDVTLTLDIELQQRIEQYLSNCNLNPNCQSPTAVAVIDVAENEILASVSMPTFDLNVIRRKYGDFASDSNEPLRNRAIYKQYPPGSVIKPIVLIAGLESANITPDEIISCPSNKAPQSWPNCWTMKFGYGHDDRWQNNSRNAIKGSCNIYFSRLADRIAPSDLQRWLFDFGYGRKISLTPAGIYQSETNKQFRQHSGVISSSIPKAQIRSFDELPYLSKIENKLFGIGQGNMRVTPLQVANAMATIARRGLHKTPRLFVDDTNSLISDSNSLNISAETLAVVYDSMRAVVNEFEGSAYKQFAYAGFGEEGVKVYGKTGSSQAPENAWFAGFARDNNHRSIALGLVVEGGQSGSVDAAPLARDIIQFCIEAGYIGDFSR